MLSLSHPTPPDEGDDARDRLAALDAQVAAVIRESRAVGRQIEALDALLTAGASQQTDGAS